LDISLLVLRSELSWRVFFVQYWNISKASHSAIFLLTFQCIYLPLLWMSIYV
jgi:hypothetical protein